MVGRLTGVQAAATLTDLAFASIAAGVIARRRPVVRMLQKMQADGRAVERMKRLRREFGCGPVELVLPGRLMVIVLDSEDVGRVLGELDGPDVELTPLPSVAGSPTRRGDTDHDLLSVGDLCEPCSTR
jgi:hypothetical protein